MGALNLRGQVIMTSLLYRDYNDSQDEQTQYG